jgi:hypothetical protein
MSISVSTLPTSDEDDQEPLVADLPESLSSGTVKLIENGEKRGQLRSLKRSHSGEDVTSTRQSYRRQRKQCTEQIREVEEQCKVASTPTLLDTPDEGPVASLVKKTTRNGKRLPLRRKGNFITQHQISESIQRGGNAPVIRNS